MTTPEQPDGERPAEVPEFFRSSDPAMEGYNLGPGEGEEREEREDGEDGEDGGGGRGDNWGAPR